jgi:polyisoprenoid-binding protein YceI
MRKEDHMGVQVANRKVEGLELPVAGKWEIDPSHSLVGFSVKHLMVAKVRGRFGSFAGTIAIGDRPEDSSVEISIDARSIDTRDEQRDAHLRSPDFFDAENHPEVSFRSTGFRRTGPRDFELPGELTIRGLTRPVVLEAEYEGITPDPFGGTRIAFTASTEIDREGWGITWNQALETGGVLVGKKVKIELEVEAVYKG